MTGTRVRLGTTSEDFVADLTDRAYRVVLAHGFQGPFVDVELGLWKALREALHSRMATGVTPLLPTDALDTASEGLAADGCGERSIGVDCLKELMPCGT